MNNKRIIVIGGAGFIGSALCKSLVELNNNVICIDDLSTGKIENIKNLTSRNNFIFRKMDILSLEPEDISKNIDYIFNLACPASPPKYQIDEVRTLKICFNGTLRSLDIARNCNAKYIFSSTSEVYGNPLEHPQSESYFGNVNTTGPRSCYDEGKRVAESLITSYCKQHKIEYSIARIFNTYGPHMDPYDGRVISTFVRQINNGENLTIFGDGQQTRSFCYVTDMVNGLIKLSESGCKGPINLGNPDEYTIKEVAEKISNIWGVENNIEYKPLPIDDPIKRKPNIDKAKLLLNWIPKINFDMGLSFIKNDVNK